MEKSVQLCLMYRDWMRDLCVRYHPLTENDERDEEFHSYLWDGYRQAKQSGEPIERFLYAAGLLTYGHIEVVDDILDNIPSGKGHIRRFAWTVNVLFPAPQGLDALQNAAGLKDWFHKNRDHLAWIESAKRFQFVTHDPS